MVMKTGRLLGAGWSSIPGRQRRQIGLSAGFPEVRRFQPANGSILLPRRHDPEDVTPVDQSRIQQCSFLPSWKRQLPGKTNRNFLYQWSIRPGRDRSLSNRGSV